MSFIEIFIYGLIAANVIFSYQGMQRRDIFERYLFSTEGILTRKEYIRFISSGFLHNSWLHLGLNMYVLYLFGRAFNSPSITPVYIVLLYFGSLIGGNALALWIRRHQYSYRAVGASGAVSGLLLAYVAFNPTGLIYLFFFLPMPGWLFAVGYIGFSIYGIRSQRDNIGHEAHLGGALIGMLITLAFYPFLIERHPWVILGILAPAAMFLYIIATRPHWLLIPGSFRQGARGAVKSISLRKEKPKFGSREEEINFLLDKGYENLSTKEKRRLEDLSS